MIWGILAGIAIIIGWEVMMSRHMRRRARKRKAMARYLDSI